MDIINSFPGYEYVVKTDEKGVTHAHNMYRGIDVGFGGYVYAEPGMYHNVALLDVSSMHPSSLILLNKLGKYTQRYADLREARVLIKHHDYEAASKLFEGKLAKYLTDDDEADALSKALKLPLNSFYGISSASFMNAARDSRDKNNIIALRGALFMKTLQDAVVEKGFKVAHIKTDSIKIPDATPEIIDFVMEFGKKYGYSFDHEATYDRICLTNRAVYIAKYDEYGIRNKGGKHANEWTATGAQFAVPYVFKTLFSKEPIIFDDYCEVKEVKSPYAMYLDMNEGLPEGRHKYEYIGRVGQFTPVKQNCGGGLLVKTKGEKYDGVTGTVGYRWLESEFIRGLQLEHPEDWVDKKYYISQVDKAKEAINKYGDFEQFVGGE